MAWIKRNEDVKDFVSYVVTKTGKTASEIISERDPKKQYRTHGLVEIAGRLLYAKRYGRTVCGVFDYDADGLMSAAEMHLLLSKLGIRHTLTIPKRFSEGYGVNPSMIERLQGNVLVTVDNGIAAKEAVTDAKKKGMEVLIMDHHNAPLKAILPPGIEPSRDDLDLPDADIIVDPEAPLPDGWDYTHYCGAGLVYKLACIMAEGDTAFLDMMCSLAAIATIADSVDVTGENGRIIEHGLDCINRGAAPEGLLAILDVLREDKVKDAPFTAESVGYYLAPMINAPGRLADAGGEFVLQCIFSKGEKAKELARQLAAINEERKKLVEECVERGGEQVDRVVFLYDERIPEGICGIIAGRLSEQYHRPTFVMTKSEEGKVKGSARCEENTSVLPLLYAAQPVLSGFGGHDQAAGFSLEESCVKDFRASLEKAALPHKDEDTEYYDFDLMPADVLLLYMEQNHVKIFGAGLELPTVRIRGRVSGARAIGSEKTHLSFQMANTKCIAFGMAAEYEELGSPEVMTIYGTVGVNWYKGQPSPQIQVKAIEK